MPAQSEPVRLPRESQEAPGPRGYPLVGVLPASIRDPLKFLRTTARDYGDVSRFRLAHRTVYLINRPEYIEQVLLSDERAYRKGAFRSGTRVVFGEGLTFSSGERWRQDRELLQPFFQKAQVAAYARRIVAAITERMASWEERARRNEALDMTDEMSQLLHALVIRLLFGGHLIETDIEAARRALDGVSRELHKYVVLEWLRRLPTPSGRRFKHALETLEQMVARLIASGRQSAPASDALARMIEARFTDAEIRDQVVTLLFGGQETSSVALSWTFYLLSQHPQVEARLQAELDTVLRGEAPTFERLGDLIYTRAVLEESLRLYPPAYVITRRAMADDIIGGYRIRAGSVVLLSQYLMHRHPAYWPKPERFDPERFAPDRSIGRPRGAYFPFGLGRRSCIGSHLAMTEMLLVLAMIYQRYRLRLPAGHTVTPQPGITLRPRGGMPMLVSARSPAAG